MVPHVKHVNPNKPHVSPDLARMETRQRLRGEQDDPEVRFQVSQIHERLDVMEKSMLEYKRQFSAYEYLWTTDLQAMFREFLEEASYDEVMEDNDGGEEEDDVGAGGGRQNNASQGGGGGGPGDGEDARVVRMLNLAKFDDKIHQYLGVQSEVAALRHTQDVGFVRVNAQPMKQAISTWVTKWIYLFAQSLQDHVSSSLERMHSFISHTQKGLETPQSVSMSSRFEATSALGATKHTKPHMTETLMGYTYPSCSVRQ